MRNPITWEADDRAVPPAAFEWLRGYTGHEHLDSFGLINMNARLYDSYRAAEPSPKTHPASMPIRPNAG